MAVVIRHGRGSTDAAAALRRIAREFHGGATVSTVQSIESVVADDLARPRLLGWMMAVFATVGLFIAAVGVYGIVAYGVARRRREIGVRMALGSSRSRVAWLVGRQTLALVAIGTALGAAAAVWMSGSLRAVLFGVEPYDPATYAAVAGILALVVCTAVALPIRRAMAVDPLSALRSE
jgi:ABC-type antimicrobial peptide transport system permease subunit